MRTATNASRSGTLATILDDEMKASQELTARPEAEMNHVLFTPSLKKLLY